MKRTHSYSSLKKWVTCPRHYQHQYVLKTIQFHTTPALERGNRVHKALEDAVKGDNTLLDKENVWVPPKLVQTLQASDAVPENKLAIDAYGQPVDFWDKSAVLRGAIDVDLTAPRANRSVMVDWKTGKVYPDAMQADCYAAMKRAELPGAAVDFYFVYVDQKQKVNERPDQKAYDRVMALIERVEADDTYVPNPCFACRFCPVSSCEYNQNPEA